MTEQTLKKQYTISVFTEDKIGLLNRITIIFTRRKINVDSLTVSESEIRGVFRFTIVIQLEPDRIEKLRGQIEKQIEVLKVFYYEDEQIVYQEIALYKMPTSAFANGDTIEKIIRKNFARILRIEPDYTIIEKTGHEHETRALFDELEPHGILSFVRSGRVAIAKPMKRLHVYLKELGNLD